MKKRMLTAIVLLVLTATSCRTSPDSEFRGAPVFEASEGQIEQVKTLDSAATDSLIFDRSGEWFGGDIHAIRFYHTEGNIARFATPSGPRYYLPIHPPRYLDEILNIPGVIFVTQGKTEMLVSFVVDNDGHRDEIRDRTEQVLGKYEEF